MMSLLSAKDNSLNGKVRHIKSVLATVSTTDVYHYERPQGLERFIVWQESGEATPMMSNNRKSNQQIEGSIDLYTNIEYDVYIDQIQEALDESSRIAWELSSVQYEDDTGLIHYEWSFTVI